MNDYSAARPFIEKAVQQPGAPRIAFLNLGILYAEQGQHDKATTAFQLAIQMDPAQVDAYWRLGRLYASIGRNQDAATEFARTKEIHKQRDEPLQSS